MSILAIILAAGFSKRMGENKLLLEYEGKTFIQTIIEKLLEINFNKIILVVSNLEIYKKYKNYNEKLFVIFNDKAENGISESIKKAVTYAKNNLEVDKYMFFVADQPLLKKETILKLIEKSNSNKIIAPKNNNTMYNPVIFPNKYTSELLNLEGDKGGKQIILKHLDDITFVDIENANEFQDVDVIEEYLKLINERKL
ncbi:NTP transferase domain-containing protein [Fusobacterium animalis]|uniref:nucleotidyltransferase family protein n=1 Tax=Fusobacterium animalis TaxID=76859 RepID=UPI0032444A42